MVHIEIKRKQIINIAGKPGYTKSETVLFKFHLRLKMTESVSLIIKWAGKEYPIDDIANSSSVLYLKQLIHAKTNVLPGRQKLLNLKLKGNRR